MKWKIGLAIVLWFLVGVALYAIISVSNSIPALQSAWCLNNWSTVAAIGTWMLTAGVVYAILQVQQMRIGTNANLAVSLFQELRQEARIEALRYIYSFKEPISPEFLKTTMTANHRDDIYNVLDQLDMLAVLVRYKVISEDLAIEGYAGATALRCWYQLQEFIKDKRKHRGVNLYENFEDFAARILEYAKKKRKKEDWIMFEPGYEGKPINLVDFFTNAKDMQPKRLKKQAKRLKIQEEQDESNETHESPISR